MILDELITDRTQEDVDYLVFLLKKGWQEMTDAEKTAFANTKGAYNYTDLNRVETAVAYVAAELVQAPLTLQSYASSLDVAWDSFFDLPYDPSDYSLTTKTNWSYSDIPTPTQMNRYLNNLVLLQSAFVIPEELPSSMSNLNYEGANQIERLILAVHDALGVEMDRIERDILSASLSYKSGEYYSGEVY